MTRNVTVSVPATSANLGPGFDCLGLALDLCNHVTFTETASGLLVEVIGEGADALPVDESNLVVRAADRLFGQVNWKPSGLHVRLENHIPVGSGLGSSAAAVLGGILAANALADDPLDQPHLLELAASFEGHPDNVTPALLGGLTITVFAAGSLVVERVPLPELKVAVVLPEFDLSTAVARQALPRQVSLEDAIHNLGRVGLLVRALELADFERLAVAMEDRLHQPYRLALIPGMEAAFKAGIQAGAASVVLSGAGPGAIAFAPAGHERIAAAMAGAFAAQGLDSRSWILAVREQGSTIQVVSTG